MNIKRLRTNGLGLISFLLVMLMFFGCRASTLPDRPVSVTPTASSATDSTEVAATITDIPKQPVWVRQAQASEIAAQENMGVQVGDTVRTEDEAMAEVQLNNGLAFRLGSNAVLTLQPANQLNLTDGQMLTWVVPGQQVPAEIVTPVAIAAIRGTTVFVDIPEDANEPILLFSWEGNVAIRLPDQTEEVLLTSGEEVTIRRGEQDIQQIRQRIRRLTPQEFRQRRERSLLFQTFQRSLPTLPQIERVAPE